MVAFFFSCRNDQGKNFFAFDWQDDFASDAELKLTNGNDAHFVVSKCFSRYCLHVFVLFKGFQRSH